MAFTHARNVLYKNAGHKVSVLNFGTAAEYSWDGIEVLPESRFNSQKNSEFDVFIFHSPKIRNHLRFLLKIALI